MFIEFLLSAVFLGILLALVSKRPEKYPPGPFIWPVVGNLLQLGLEPHKTALKLRDTYGDLLGVYFGAERVVIINDVKLMKEAFSLNSMSGRPGFKHVLHPESGKKRGVIFADGSAWVEQRRFILKNLRDFGFGKKSMESMVSDEVDEIIEYLRKSSGKSVDTHLKFNVAVVNALWTIVNGEKFSHSDPKIRELLDLLAANLSSSKVANRAFPFPWLTKIAPNFSGHNEYVNNFLPVLKFIQGSVDAHERSYEEGTKRDLIDCYLQEMRQAPKSSSFFSKDGEENLLFGVYDLFLAGAETTSTTLTWLCYFLSLNPKVQEKLNKVITENVGTARKPVLADRPSMPYVEAVLMEVMRNSALVPFGVPHQAMEDVDFHGYVIPKGTHVLANQFGILNDPKVWGDPENFRPERFLSPDEKTVLRNEAFIPFSTGKRVCLGESLAKDELFLFTTGLFQRFKVQFDPNAPAPEEAHSKNTPILVPPKHKVIFSDRYEK